MICLRKLTSEDWMSWCIVRIGYALFKTYLHPTTDNRHALCTHRDVNRGRHINRWIGLNFQAPHEDRMKELVIWLLIKVKLLGIDVMLLGTWPTFFFLSWPICTYTITWSRLTWPLTCTTEPSCQELHCSLLLYVFHCSLLMVVCDHHCSWPYCSVTLIVHDLIVLRICMLSQVAALLYISWTYILELGLKPDLVCNLLRSLSLLLEQTFPFYFSLK